MRKPISTEVRRAICRGVERGDCLGELEVIGLSTRIISMLEHSKFNIITLEELLIHREDQLLTIHSFGATTIDSIFNCLADYDKFEEIVNNPDSDHLELAAKIKDQYTPLSANSA